MENYQIPDFINGNSMPPFQQDFTPAFLDVHEELNAVTWEETENYLRSKSKKKRNPETKLIRTIIDWLHAHGCVAIRVNSGMIDREYKGRKYKMRMNSQSGCSDILACIKTVGAACFAAIEVKSGSNPVSQKQQAFLNRIASSGGIPIIARSISDLEKALPWLTN